MKNAILSFAFLLIAAMASAQSDRSPAQEMTEKLAQKYNLTEQQQADMLVIQDRKLHNLSEIEGLKKTDLPLYIQKMRALKMGTDSSIERLLTEDQLAVFRKEKADFRKQKSETYSGLKASGASQMQIDYKISELEEAALMGN